LNELKLTPCLYRNERRKYHKIINERSQFSIRKRSAGEECYTEDG